MKTDKVYEKKITPEELEEDLQCVIKIKKRDLLDALTATYCVYNDIMDEKAFDIRQSMYTMLTEALMASNKIKEENTSKYKC